MGEIGTYGEKSGPGDENFARYGSPARSCNKRAVFLDRDGVLTVEKGYVLSAEEMEIFPYASECVAGIHDKGYLAIVVTNQSGVARGLFSEGELLKMNQILVRETGVDDIYFCPHYENGIVPKYSIACGCRKPQIGMIAAAAEKYGIDLASSYMVGDRATDIIMGQRAGTHTVLLESGYGTKRLEQSVEPDYILDDLRDVTRIIG